VTNFIKIDPLNIYLVYLVDYLSYIIDCRKQFLALTPGGELLRFYLARD